MPNFLKVTVIILSCLILSSCQKSEAYLNEMKTISISSEMSKTSETTISDKENEEVKKKALEDEIFLKEYVYGGWTFTKRLVECDDSYDDTGGYKSNFSENGIDELTGLSLIFSKDSIGTYGEFLASGPQTYNGNFPLGHDNILSNPYDVYLFGLYGGFNSQVTKPIYSITSGEITVSNVFRFDEEAVKYFDISNVVRVTYDLKNKSDSYVRRRNLGDILYIVDKEDTDTLYIDFCGIWEMKRFEVYDGMKSKHFYDSP